MYDIIYPHVHLVDFCGVHVGKYIPYMHSMGLIYSVTPPFTPKEFERYMDVSKNWGKPPKMDGENNGKPYFLMDDLEVPLFLDIFGNTHMES